MIVTVTELVNPLLPINFLFVFALEQSQGEDSYVYKRQFENVSTSTIRYDEFILNEPADIDFQFEGDYSYKIYQMPNAESTDETEGELLEQGKMRLKAVAETAPTFIFRPNVEIHG
jgi:hypothetical protein